jgi:hypothetical protein
MHWLSAVQVVGQAAAVPLQRYGEQVGLPALPEPRRVQDP